MNLNFQHIYVKLLELSDAEAMLRLELRNRDFFQLYTPSRNQEFYTVEGQLNRIKRSIEMRDLDQHYLFGVYLKDSDELIGNVTLSEVVRGDLQSCWIGYYLDKNHNGKGYMTSAVRLGVSYAFCDLKLHRIEAGVMPHNVASIKVLEKAGFHQEGISKKNVKINGAWQDHVLLAIVNDDRELDTTTAVQYKNPTVVSAPIGPYSHLSIVPKNSDLLVLSGQIGTDVSGHIPSDAEEQFQNALDNVVRILSSENVGSDGIMKVNIWLTEPINKEGFSKIWANFHGGTPPAMTLAFVSALGTPSLKVEVEVWAARP